MSVPTDLTPSGTVPIPPSLPPNLLSSTISPAVASTTTLPPVVVYNEKDGNFQLRPGATLDDIPSEFNPNDPNYDPSLVRALLVETRTTAECGLGYLCEEDLQVNCTKLQFLTVAWGLGNVHAGLSCPFNDTRYLNCPVGSYCPNPEEVNPCPAGKFCPHKTAVPEVSCGQCEEGATELARARYGYIILIILLVAAVTYFVYRLIKRYQDNQLERLASISRRRIDSVKIQTFLRKQQKELELIKPQLELIAKRLKRDDRDQTSAASVGSLPWEGEKNIRSGAGKGSLPWEGEEYVRSSGGVSVGEDGRVEFNARVLFNEIDADQNGVLSYQELNAILQLDPMRLREFVRRMNTLGRQPRTQATVSRSVFCRHFVTVLVETSQLRPTSEEAASLFDEIAQQHGTNKMGGIASDKFYKSSMANFLSDSQIHDVLVRLRSYQIESGTVIRSGSFRPGDVRPGISIRQGLSLISTAGERARPRFSIVAAGKERAIQRDVFVKHYPEVLGSVLSAPDAMSLVSTRLNLEHDGKMEEDTSGVDIAFENLSLTVTVGDNDINVVDNVTGRLAAGTMTALMGGSGAGKSSLLNALCGRAFYGKTGGKIRINGQDSSIEEQSHCIGFVPQDDIVYAELTVRENFVYSGRFQLPKGTPLEDIYDLADATLANLGLSRVANSIVGDVQRRGVSGGEKKRVNIGLELMSRPKALFLDEPTSGLDSSSALLVMQSLRALVENQGVTVCSVIHQPRKVIFELFDNLILLGVGGKVVYNGPVDNAKSYVEGLGYTFPVGDSVADWLIDVSAGQAERQDADSAEQEESDGNPNANRRESRIDPDYVHNAGPSSNQVEEEFERAKVKREQLYLEWESYFEEKLTDEEKERYQPPEAFDLPKKAERASFRTQLWVQICRSALVSRRNLTSKLMDTFIIVAAVVLIAAFEGIAEITRDNVPEIVFEELVSGVPEEHAAQFPEMFTFATRGTVNLTEYALKTGILASVLIGLTAAKAINEKRLEFFREAASGYDVNAYFVAVNIMTVIEHSFQTIIAAVAAYWLRDSLASRGSYYVTFLMLSWLCTSWALLLPLLVPPKNVVLVTGFFMAFFGLLFSGGLAPVKYTQIYDDDNEALALFSGFVSPTRYFIESLVVAELRCLPEQSGFTHTEDAVNFLPEFQLFNILNFGRNDLSVNQKSCSGWYWGVLPAFLVGLTIRIVAAGTIHISGRPQQAKRPLSEELRRRGGPDNKQCCTRIRVAVIIFLALFALFFSLACWSILRTVGYDITQQKDIEALANETAAENNNTLTVDDVTYVVDNNNITTRW